MNVTKLRYASLGLLAVTALYTGIWAYFSPESWHANFPGFGLSWLPQLGPYNQHLAKDAGAMFLAMATLTIITLRYVRDNRAVRTAGAVWLVFNVLHLIYHMRHLHMYETRDQILNVVSLSSLVVLSIPLLVTSLPGRRDDTR
jgi:heme/copper-type cytochrome/quinol oxidase subunit 4